MDARDALFTFTFKGNKGDPIRYCLAEIVTSEQRFSLQAQHVANVIAGILDPKHPDLGGYFHLLRDEDKSLLQNVLKHFLTIAKGEKIWREEIENNIKTLPSGNAYLDVPVWSQDENNLCSIITNTNQQLGEGHSAFEERVISCGYLSFFYEKLLKLFLRLQEIGERSSLCPITDFLTANSCKLAIDALLITPVQRLARWPLLLNDLELKIAKSLSQTGSKFAAAQNDAKSLTRKFVRQARHLDENRAIVEARQAKLTKQYEAKQQAEKQTQTKFDQLMNVLGFILPPEAPELSVSYMGKQAVESGKDVHDLFVESNIVDESDAAEEEIDWDGLNKFSSSIQESIDILECSSIGQFVELFSTWSEKYSVSNQGTDKGNGKDKDKSKDKDIKSDETFIEHKIEIIAKQTNADRKRLLYYCYLVYDYLITRPNTEKVCAFLESFIKKLYNILNEIKILENADQAAKKKEKIISEIETSMIEKMSDFRKISCTKDEEQTDWLLSADLNNFEETLNFINEVNEWVLSFTQKKDIPFIINTKKLIEIVKDMGNSMMFRYVAFTKEGQSTILTSQGEQIVPLMNRVRTISGMSVSNQAKQTLLEKAVLETYWQIRKNQGSSEDRVPLADTLDEFIVSKNGLNMPLDMILDPFFINTRKLFTHVFYDNAEDPINLTNYMKNANIAFKGDNSIEVNHNKPEYRARIQIILSDLASKHNEIADQIRPFLDNKDMQKSKKQYPFTCAFQTLKIYLSPAHLITGRIERVKELMNELENIRANINMDEVEKRDAMVEPIKKMYRLVKGDAQSRFFGSQSNLADALTSFMKNELEISDNAVANLPPTYLRRSNKSYS